MFNVSRILSVDKINKVCEEKHERFTKCNSSLITKERASAGADPLQPVNWVQSLFYPPSSHDAGLLRASQLFSRAILLCAVASRPKMCNKYHKFVNKMAAMEGKAPTPVHVFVSLTPKTPEDEAGMKEVCTGLVTESRKEPGCSYYHFYPSAEQPSNVFYIVEKYVDAAAVDTHNSSSHFSTLIPQLLAKADIQFIKRAPQQTASAKVATVDVAKGSAAQVRFVVSVFVTDESKFIETAQQLTEASLSEAGCCDYTFAKVDDSPDNEYLFVELWKSDEALEFHRTTPHCKALIPVLDSCSTVKAAFKAYE